MFVQSSSHQQFGYAPVDDTICQNILREEDVLDTLWIIRYLEDHSVTDFRRAAPAPLTREWLQGVNVMQILGRRFEPAANPAIPPLRIEFMTRAGNAAPCLRHAKDSMQYFMMLYREHHLVNLFAQYAYRILAIFDAHPLYEPAL